jgi:hypothetical protein
LGQRLGYYAGQTKQRGQVGYEPTHTKMVRILSDKETRTRHDKNVYVFVCRGCEDIMFTTIGSKAFETRLCSNCQKNVI